jgi:AcrR family transcriptional regulator
MTAGAKPKRLPRGRHGLSREEVAESQRDRMLRALADAVAEKGYAKTSVADVLTRAGVSRETFYEQFSSKEDCFLETFDRAGEILLERAAGTPNGDTVEERFDALLKAYLDTLASEPAYARVYLVDSYAAGPEAVRRRAALQGRFVNALVELFGLREPHERFACELLVAAVGSMVTTRVALGDHATLPELREPIVELVRRLVD